MANVKISQLPSLSTMTDIAQIPVVAGGTTYQITGANLSSYFGGDSYGNANVVANLAALGTNPVSTTGNITGSYILGNGSQLTGLPATYGNANVAANLAAFADNPILTTGNIGAGNINVTTATGNLVFGRASATGSPGLNSTGSFTVVANRFGTPTEWVFTTDGSFTGLGNISGGNVNTGKVANTGNLTFTAGSSSWNFDTTGNLTVPGNINAVLASPAPSLNNFDSISAANLSASGNVISVRVSASGNITGGNLITSGTVTLPNSSTLTFGDTPVTNRYYIDATRTDTYTQNGSQARPFKTIAAAQAAIATAIAGGLNPEVEPIYMILLSNITENVTLATNHVYLIGQNGQIHQPIILTGNITVQPTSGTLNSNHFSISGMEIVGGTNGKAIYVTGTFPTRLSLQDVWITANGNSGAGLYQDNTGTGTYTHGGPIKVSHNGTGDVYCFDIRKGAASFDTVETSGATQVGAAGPGATLTFNNSQLDANGDVVVETYGNGVLVVTNSVIKNSATNSYGIKLNAVANVAGTVSVGQSAFNVPLGTGQAVWLDPNTTPGLSGVFAWSGASFYPGTNTTIAPLAIPGPLPVLVGTIASPILYGDITSYAVAQDWDLIDNNASALSFDTTGKAGVLELVTTNSAEGVKMSGFASVVGNITGGNVLTGGLISATGNITGGNATLGTLTLSGNTISSTDAIITIDPSAAGNTGAVIIQGNLSVTGNVTYIDSNTITTNDLVINMANNAATAAAANGGGIGVGPVTGAYATITYNSTANIWAISNGASVTGNVTGGNIITAAAVSAASVSASGNITGGNILTAGQLISSRTGNSATGAGQLYLNGTGNNRIDFNTNGTGAPAFTTRSAGAKVVLFPNISGSAADYALGIDSGVLWSGVPDASGQFKWYAGTTQVGSLSGAGAFSAAGNITGGNVTTAGLTNTASLSITGNTATVTSANYSIGYLEIPQVTLSANTTAGLTDSGKHYYSTTAGNLELTIPDNSNVAFPVGTAISVVVQAGGNVLVVTQPSTTLYLGGNATSGNRVVGTYGMATIMKVATNTWFISGTGVS